MYTLLPGIPFCSLLNLNHCLWNESNIHPLQQALWKSRNFSLCGKGGILGGRSGQLGPGWWITNAAQSSALHAQMFLSGRRDLGMYAKNYGERVTFTSFTTDPGVPKKRNCTPFPKCWLIFQPSQTPPPHFLPISLGARQILNIWPKKVWNWCFWAKITCFLWVFSSAVLGYAPPP